SVEFHISLSAQVTLDPRTAHAKLLVADDLSSVRQATAAQDVPATPERFLSPPCVLGLRGFSSGRHYWEVEVTGQGSWAVGVARGSVPRDRCLPVMVNRDVWALCHCTGADKVLNLPKIDDFDLEVPQKLRVVLDLQEGRVVFFDANTEKRLYTFQEASF
ncbi:PREDICTED: tripartite motif-containing protein 58-like, partial [Buceros rhinoceros silvestris]|uniref:tripartite motif-containing protein 58-like n=1 Tax=Buceros rhinoceros silvestris TaxID=175836 RepID=UPI0005293911